MYCARHCTGRHGEQIWNSLTAIVKFNGVRFPEIAIIICCDVEPICSEWLVLCFIVYQKYFEKITRNLTLFGEVSCFKQGCESVCICLKVILIPSRSRGCQHWIWRDGDGHDREEPVSFQVLCYSCRGNDGWKLPATWKKWQLFQVLKC